MASRFTQALPARSAFTQPATVVKRASQVATWAALGLSMLAFGWRLFRLARDPLWFDEIYSVQIVQQSLRVILANSAYEAHPPLCYLVLWLSTGFGAAGGEWWWRLSSVLFGTLTVPVVYAGCRRCAGAWGALCASVWLAFSPTALYFSQETRWPAFAAFLAALSLWLLTVIQARPAERRLWWTIAAVTVFGVFSSYAYLMIAAVQIPYLAWTLRRERGSQLLVLLLVAAALVSSLMALRVLPGVAAKYAGTEPMGARLPLLDLLVADPVRYGYSWAHTWLAPILFCLGLAGAAYAVWKRPVIDQSYALVQVAAPLALFGFVAVPILQIHLPLFEDRQFFVLLPAVCVLLAHGMALLLERFPIWLAVILTAGVFSLVVASDAISTQRYWSTTKSPEGDLALALRQEAQPGDAVVSLHYSLDAALSLYGPQGVNMFAKPIAGPSGYVFSNSLSILYNAQYTNPYHLADIRRSKRVWVLARQGNKAEVVATLSSGCTVAAPQTFPPFELLRLDDCPPA